jgi:hypothetical protein
MWDQKAGVQVEPAVQKTTPGRDVARGSFLMGRGSKALLPLLHYLERKEDGLMGRELNDGQAPTVHCELYAGSQALRSHGVGAWPEATELTGERAIFRFGAS